MVNKVLKEDGSAIPANAMGASSSSAGTGAIDTFDPKIGTTMVRKKKLREIVPLKSPILTRRTPPIG